MKLKYLIATTVPLLILDIFWLSITAPSFYQDRIGVLLREDFAIAPAALFYLIFTVGLTYFIVSPSIKNKYSILRTALNGALFGLICYATYDLTNLATINDWSVTVTLVDMIWGAVLSATASSAATIIIRKTTR
jgi:uncharacterized membrane protein